MIKIDIKTKIPTVTAQQVRINTKTGRFYKSNTMRSAESVFVWELKNHLPAKPLSGPILLEILWVFETKDKRKIGKYKMTRPDLDNHQKIIQDCMTRLGFWEDDNKVSCIISSKIWGEEEGVCIRVMSIGEPWNGHCLIETLGILKQKE